MHGLMTVGQDRIQHPRGLGLGCRALGFYAYFGEASVGFNEFLVEGRQIDLLIRVWNRLVLR